MYVCGLKMNNTLAIFPASSAFISHLYFSSEPGCQLGPDFNLGLGRQGALGLLLSRRPRGPGGLGGLGSATALGAYSEATEVRAAVDLLVGNLLEPQ